MADTLETQIRTLLGSETAPRDTADLITAGRLSGVFVSGQTAGIVLDFGAAAPEGVENFTNSLEEKLRAATKAEISIVLTGGKGSRPAASLSPAASASLAAQSSPKFQPAQSQAAQSQPAQSQPAQPQPPKPHPIDGVKHIIAVASGKGGVGKSTTSINLALALKDMGLMVGILDADIFGPSLPHLLDIKDKPDTQNGKIVPLEKWGLKAMSIGFMIDVDQPVVWRGPRVMGATQQMLHDVLWGPLDILVVDMPPGTGDVQLTMVQRASLSGAVIVSTPQDLALIDAKKAISMFVKVGVPIMGIIENMSHFICPKCGEVSHIFDHGGAEKTAAKLKVPFLGALPLTMAIRQQADEGYPTVEATPDSPETGYYRQIADQIAHQLSLI